MGGLAGALVDPVLFVCDTVPDQRTHLLSEHGSILNVVKLPDDHHVENQLGDDGAIRTLELVHQIGSDPHFLNGKGQ
jgi:hypothetical protein